MSTSSSESAEANSVSRAGEVTATIEQRVGAIAQQSSSQNDFLRRLADELRTTFEVALVAIEASQWSSPKLLTSDKVSRPPIDSEVLSDLLATASVMPIACDIPHASGDGVAARAIRVELHPEPQRASVMLVYPHEIRLDSAGQIADLKHLGEYAESTRGVIDGLPVESGAELVPAETALSISKETVGSRHSLRLFHLDLDIQGTAYRIANESRRLLQCDRCTVLTLKSGRLCVSAISGVAVVDQRSNDVRAIERLTRAASVMARPMFLPNEDPLPPQVDQPLQSYLDETGVLSTVLLPLHAPSRDSQAEGVDATEIDPFDDRGELIGVMALEYFSGNPPIAIDHAMRTVATEATLSLRNALEHRQVFGLALWKSVGGAVQRTPMPKAAAALVILVTLLLASIFYQVEHHVIATGTVEPTHRREVFAAVDGIVKELHVRDGQQVAKGDLLFELDNAELESQAEALTGEIQTATQRLASIKAVRLSNAADPGQTSRLVLEERQLTSELASLRAQQEVVEAQQRELRITSPIDGTVIGWQLERRLSDRPVARGNLLLSVADHTGAWSLRLRVPDQNAGPVLESAQVDPNLRIEFAVATQPEASFAARLDSLSTAARLDELGTHVIDATANVIEVPKEQGELDLFVPSNVRVGADVTAKIACGKRSVLRSWFGDVFDFVHRNILFYF